MRADAIDEPLAAQSVVGLNEDGASAFPPAAALSRPRHAIAGLLRSDAALLNLLRTKVRETESPRRAQTHYP